MASPHPTNPSEITPATMIRWGLFVLLVAFVSWFYLILDFRGLSHAKGMEQAQLAREIARGYQNTTKVVKPLQQWQINEHRLANDDKAGPAPLIGQRDTYHAPLNPLINSISMRLLKKEAKPGEPDGLVFDPKQETVFFLDYVIAGLSMVLLLAAIGISYMLVSHIFDRKIAGVTSLLMLLCPLLWKFAQSGLPQPLMLFLFSFAMYFFYRAIECVQIGRSPFLWAVLTALFFGLLALAHWIAVWIFVGALLYAAFFLRPQGLVALAMLVVFLLIVAWWPLLVNLPTAGNPMGSGFYQFYAGLAGGSESMVMRNFNPEQLMLNPDGFLRKIAYGTIAQLASIFTFMGGIVAAPLFFISLLHPFKRPEIARFRWAVLMMWVWAAIGMAIFGLPEGEKDANQLHILFIPVMTAYGLALLSVLWSRLSLPVEFAMVRNGHFIIAVIVSAAPFLLTAPWDIVGAMSRDFKANWPPYLPLKYAEVAKGVAENEIVVSDAPWAMAWYGDRTSLWLPRTRAQFMRAYEDTKAQGYPMAGILLTPISTHQPYASQVSGRGGEYGEWGALIENYNAIYYYRTSTLIGLEENFPFKVLNQLLPSADMVFYSDRSRVRP